mmetsp:Transcript_108829/g.318408  ORF Transcript_108829/g.318408 Transcript_108829/m.318408 type:complete len:212 (+) Transcript_108829:526-1161(+)
MLILILSLRRQLYASGPHRFGTLSEVAAVSCAEPTLPHPGPAHATSLGGLRGVSCRRGSQGESTWIERAAADPKATCDSGLAAQIAHACGDAPLSCRTRQGDHGQPGTVLFSSSGMGDRRRPGTGRWPDVSESGQIIRAPGLPAASKAANHPLRTCFPGAVHDESVASTAPGGLSTSSVWRRVGFGGDVRGVVPADQPVPEQHPEPQQWRR